MDNYLTANNLQSDDFPLIREPLETISGDLLFTLREISDEQKQIANKLREIFRGVAVRVLPDKKGKYVIPKRRYFFPGREAVLYDLIEYIDQIEERSFLINNTLYEEAMYIFRGEIDALRRLRAESDKMDFYKVLSSILLAYIVKTTESDEYHILLLDVDPSSHQPEIFDIQDFL